MNKFFTVLKSFFTAPVFEGDQEKAYSAKLLHQITMAVWSLPFVAVFVSFLNPSLARFVLPTAIVLVVAQIIIMFLNHVGRVRLASNILVGLMCIVLTYLNYSGAGEPRPLLLLTVIAIMMSGLLLGGRSPIVVAILLATQHIIILSLYARGLIMPQSTPAGPLQNAVVTTVSYLLIGFMLRLAISRIQFAVNQLQISNRELQELSTALEQRVAERTKALETSAVVSRRLTAILDPSQLASEVVHQVKTAFDYYHAQIFLFDEADENLVTTAGTGEAGAEMLRRGFSIPKGRGLVGRAAETNQPVLVSDVSQDPDWLPNPSLPETKAEAAIPIALGDRVLGVLDVQDAIMNDINSGDITLLQSLASQIAVSLRTAETYALAESALQEAKSLVENAPEAIIIVDLTTGLFTDPNENAVKLYGLPREELVKVGPAQMSPPTQPDGRDSTEKAMEKIGQAMQGKTPVFEWIHRNGQGQDFPCEVRLVPMPGDRPRVRASVTDITERRHLQDLTAQRARQQEAINLITQRIQAATTIEEAMQVAARELGHALGKRPTLVALNVDTLASSTTKK
jgi:PAS domain S-box-containing protein